MPSLTFAITIVIGAFAALFSKPVFALANLLRVGTILAPGKRTVRAVLRVMGKSADIYFQNYHRVLNGHRSRPVASYWVYCWKHSCQKGP
jgi:hypothetical protein